MKHKKPKPRIVLFSLYWWNPFMYLMFLIMMFYCIWDGGLKEWWIDTTGLIKNATWF